MYLTFLLLNLFLCRLEARVFCEDSNADSWTPLGYSCPLNCGNIVATVQRLRLIDYHSFITKNWPNNYTDVTQGELKKLHMAQNIDSMETITRYMEIIHHRRLNGLQMHDLLVKFHNLLNNLTAPHYRFSMKLTRRLLTEILTTEMDSLREAGNDVSKLLEFLRLAIEKHRTHLKSIMEPVYLKSRHCLTITVPGCFCKQGYVENNGQCVRPSDCFHSGTAEINKDYLTRIIVL